jgi:hypothetical protein
MMTSIKQIIRKPGKALIFFLLIIIVTVLLSFSTVSMLQTNQRIDTVEGQFSTIATVEQELRPGDALLHADMLDFEGAEYVNPPETRPYYLARVPGVNNSGLYSHIESASVHVAEFTPVESGGYTEPVKMQIVKSYYDKYDHTKANWIGFGSQEKDLEAGDVAYFLQDYIKTPTSYEKGKTYIANFQYDDSVSQESGIPVYSVSGAPFTTQREGELGQKIESTVMPSQCRRFDEVTEDFWGPGGLGMIWTEWIEQLKLWDRNWLPVIPTNGVQLLPTFHSKNAYMDRGREITAEEFKKGSNVCMISDKIALNGIKVGDTINLPMYMAFYGFQPDRFYTFEFPFAYDFSPLNAEGEAYGPFWQKEYEVVGIYRQLTPGAGELYGEAVIIPSKSVTVSDENNIVYYAPMNSWSTSFQIPNGKISEFNTALHKAVPEASKLKIVYNDNGYEEVMASLYNARLSTALLLGASILAGLVVILLLLYFFVVKEKKRTAIERSLGMTKNQCRVSILSGLMALAIPAVLLGGWISWGMMNIEAVPVQEGGHSEDNIETVSFSREYSLWAESESSVTDIGFEEVDIYFQMLSYFLVPLCIVLTVLLLTVFIVNRNLKIEPIILLGGRE